MSHTDVTGTVGALWRYPVKSLLGERIGRAEATDRGLAGDRRLALLDRETGKVASAKAPRRWSDLLRCTATTTPSGARITAPDGTTWESTDPDVHDGLSAYTGRPVTLTATPPPAATLDRSRPEEVLGEGAEDDVTADVTADVVGFAAAAPGTFFDFAPVHLITTATLARIAALSPRATVEPERYRPNLLITTADEGFTENHWLGKELTIGEHVTLHVIALTPRCAVPTLIHGDLPRDPDALRVPARHNRVPALPGRAPEACAGAYARVVRGGWIQEGDAVRLG
ncbi:MOSC domain-containing protein [Streptomyces aurantiogriseus]|uniref:Molybdenum cofactor biosysynthesis protein n=1 Tax=Streptomyces aurantiogriseus TaxID=66870 RepID=A0A918FL26_9ACTN|nr:MOSC N-terminal beta barrel domain-containing protein [Streptomyces aurantiogriseus]GGR43818.1 molybdenum cofactor biosysynthesis protein [Streptomyces aurantiogriseus]